MFRFFLGGRYKKKMGGLTLLDLNDDVLRHIFSFLKHEDCPAHLKLLENISVNILHLTCKRFRELCPFKFHPVAVHSFVLGTRGDLYLYCRGPEHYRLTWKRVREGNEFRYFFEMGYTDNVRFYKQTKTVVRVGRPYIPVWFEMVGSERLFRWGKIGNKRRWLFTHWISQERFLQTLYPEKKKRKREGGV